LKRIDKLIDAKRTDAVLNELTLLSFLVEDYENKFHTMPDASPVEVIRLAMDLKGFKQKDLIPVLGTKGNVSKILSEKANLQLEDLHPLSVLLGIPVDALVPKDEIYNNPKAPVKRYPAEPIGRFDKGIATIMEPSSKSYRLSQTRRAAAKKKSAKRK